MIPTPNQKQAIRTILRAKKPALWAGAIRSGKTVGAGLGLVLHAQARNGQYIIAGKSSTAVKRNIIPPIREACRSLKIPFKWKRSEQTITIGGSKGYYFGANNEASQDYIQGLTADGFLLDELPLLPKSFYVQAIGRCSQPDPFMLATMNKVSPNHWTKRELVDEGQVVLIESAIEDNPHITKETIALYRSAIGGHYAARMLDNKWADATGRIWGDIPEWNKQVKDSAIYVGMDAAESGTTAALFFRRIHTEFGQPTDMWLIIGEYTHKGVKSYDDHATMIAEREPYEVYCDPSAPGLIAALRKQCKTVIPANNTVDKGLQTVSSALMRGKLWKLPGACPNLDKEMSGYVWDEKAANVGEDKPTKNDDHHCDALRYFAMGRIPMVNLRPTKKGAGL